MSLNNCGAITLAKWSTASECKSRQNRWNRDDKSTVYAWLICWIA